MGLQEDFETATKDALTLLPTTSYRDELILYGLYKQATVGKINISQPSGMFEAKERSKWYAWKNVEGKTKEEAMGDYITKVNQLTEASTLKEAST